MQFKPRDTVFTPLIGPEAGFQLTSFEVRRPDPHGRVTPIQGPATVRMPEEVLQDIRRHVDEVRAGFPVIAQAMAGAQMREVLATLGKRTKRLTKREMATLRRKLAQSEKTILPYHLGLAALSGQVPLNIARYILLERSMAETMALGGMAEARRKDAFDLLLAKGANSLREGKVLTGHDAYPTVAAIRDRIGAHLAQPEHEAPLMPVLDHWYTSDDCRTIMRYAAQYKSRAIRFLFKRPLRYTQGLLGPSLRTIWTSRRSCAATAPSRDRAGSFGTGGTGASFHCSGKESRNPAERREDQPGRERSGTSP